MLSIFLFPLWQTMKSYSAAHFPKDAIAGLTVALLALPQAMAYAFVAGLPPQVGIFSAIFGTLFASAFGASFILISGPTTQIAILLQSGISEIISTYYTGVSGPPRDVLAMQILMQVTVITGVMQIIGGIFNLGRLTQFASRAVIVGYMLGAAVAIVLAQAFPFLGIPPPRGHYPLFEKVWLLVKALPQLHLPTAILGILCLSFLLLFSRVMRPGLVPFIIFLFATLAVFLSKNYWFQGEFAHVRLLQDLGPVYRELPEFFLPQFELRTIGSIVPLSFAICLISVLQATAIGRAYTRAKDPSYHDNQEIYAMGISNTAISFIGAMPIAGSFSLSEMNYCMGAKSRIAGMLSSLFLFAILFFLSPLVTSIPLTALAALLFINAFNLVNFKDLLLCLRATREDAFVLLMTSSACFLFTFDTALYIGIAISVVLYLRRAATPLFIEYTFTGSGKLRPLDPEDERPDPRIAIFQTEGELFFGAAELLQNKLRLIGEDETIKILILQLLNVRRIDASICIAFKNIHRYFKDTQRKLLITGVSKEVFAILQEAGLVEKIGKEQIYLANEQLPGEPTRRAYANAKSLLGPH